MAIAERKQVEIGLTAKVIEQCGNFAQSQEHGTLLTLQSLPQFMQNGLLAGLENTTHYKKEGHVWFYLADGTKMNGPYRFKSEAKTIEEMFTKVSKEEWKKLPYNKRAYFYGGNRPLSLHLYNVVRDNRRLNIDGERSPDYTAPVVVIAQVQSQAGREVTAQKIDHELVGRFRTAVAKVEEVLHQDITEVLKKMLRAIK